MNYCVISGLGTVRRENGIGTLQLTNNYQVNISDDGLKNVYTVYMTEVLKARTEQIKKPNKLNQNKIRSQRKEKNDSKK